MSQLVVLKKQLDLFPILDPKNIRVPSFNKVVHFIGNEATLDGCKFSSVFTNDITISWLKNGSVLDVDSRFTSEWDTNSFNVTVSPLVLTNLNSSDSGDYSCRLTYNKTSVTDVVSPIVKLTVSSNKVEFTSKPKVIRTLEETVVVGCSYSSLRSFDLNSFSYILLGGETFNINTTTVEGEALSFSMGNYTFSHFVKNSTVQCLIQIGEERFTSNSSTLYESPVYQGVPELQSIQQNGVTLSGCQFQYHQDLKGFASLVGFDENQREISNIQTNLMTMSEDDMYRFGSVLLTSYANVDQYYKCKLYDSDAMPNASFSGFSKAMNISGKCFSGHFVSKLILHYNQ